MFRVDARGTLVRNYTNSARPVTRIENDRRERQSALGRSLSRSLGRERWMSHDMTIKGDLLARFLPAS
jgi:hypothetical protein